MMFVVQFETKEMCQSSPFFLGVLHFMTHNVDQQTKKTSVSEFERRKPHQKTNKIDSRGMVVFLGKVPEACSFQAQTETEFAHHPESCATTQPSNQRKIA